MEARGGNGYIEDWVNPRLIRDAQVGLLWEGTSNINALDVIGRAVGKSGAHRALQALLRRRLDASASCRRRSAMRWATRWSVRSHWPSGWRGRGRRRWRARRRPRFMTYPAPSCWHGRARRPGADAGRTLLSRFVLAHRLSPRPTRSPRKRAGGNAPPSTRFSVVSRIRWTRSPACWFELAARSRRQGAASGVGPVAAHRPLPARFDHAHRPLLSAARQPANGGGDAGHLPWCTFRHSALMVC